MREQGPGGMQRAWNTKEPYRPRWQNPSGRDTKKILTWFTAQQWPFCWIVHWFSNTHSERDRERDNVDEREQVFAYSGGIMEQNAIIVVYWSHCPHCILPQLGLCSIGEESKSCGRGKTKSKQMALPLSIHSSLCLNKYINDNHILGRKQDCWLLRASDGPLEFSGNQRTFLLGGEKAIVTIFF